MPKAQQVNIHIVTQPDEELEFYVKVCVLFLKVKLEMFYPYE